MVIKVMGVLHLMCCSLSEVYPTAFKYMIHLPCYIYSTRVESESDDPHNLAVGHLSHFFVGSSGSHLQTKLPGCDPDTTCLLDNSVGIW